ncbi:cell division protein ZapA [Motiliproteus coralliicola]|uniref:Cell division protein ZapA n=1 Tax=Motiliproteus coralliicola TaxID=2283196 RepID=A0A369WBU9_9GAMM|nr:cell division protein ZapA [Motiliproteus coralliicola]RDE18184.1 cell division protein ZapA [Motiliproteus coralliicola]
MSDANKVQIQIQGKEFLISCPTEAQPELLASAQLLNQRMDEIKQSGKVYGLDRISVMAALNLTHELLQTQRELEALKQQQQHLSDQIAKAMAGKNDTDKAPA